MSGPNLRAPRTHSRKRCGSVGDVAGWGPWTGTPLRNDDVDWDRWPVTDYLDEVYREVYPSDAAIIDHHSRYFRGLPPDSVERSLELGAGPNLYPLMLAAAASRRIDALEYSAANVAYLRGQLADGPEASWQAFYERCRRGNPALPATLAEALTRVTVVHGNALSVPPGTYDLASMHFVGESITEDRAEFDAFCQRFIEAVRPGGRLIAAFMEGQARYQIKDGPQWPGYEVDVETVRTVFAPSTVDLVVERIEGETAVVDIGSSGMVVLTARRPPA
jgi:hypothetical protein